MEGDGYISRNMFGGARATDTRFFHGSGTTVLLNALIQLRSQRTDMDSGGKESREAATQKNVARGAERDTYVWYTANIDGSNAPRGREYAHCRVVSYVCGLYQGRTSPPGHFVLAILPSSCIWFLRCWLRLIPCIPTPGTYAGMCFTICSGGEAVPARRWWYSFRLWLL